MVELAFLFDVDNTLLDNDGVKADLAARIERLVGATNARRFWSVYEDVRRACDFVDFPRTLVQYRAAYPQVRRFAQVADLVLGYPYRQALYPGALEAITRLRGLGRVAIVSDGDPVYQAAKIARAGLAEAVDDNVLLYAHKEAHFDDVLRRVPAAHHVLVDDKLRILASVRHLLGDRVRTVFVCQGHYAAAERGQYPPADIELAAIGELATLPAEMFA